VSVLTPHFVVRHADGEFAGRLEHYFPVADAAGKCASYEALRSATANGATVAVRGNLTGRDMFVPARDIQCL
jgi:hypothetical protein